MLFSKEGKASKVPLSVFNNIAFLMDVNAIGHPSDLLFDVCDVWT